MLKYLRDTNGEIVLDKHGYPYPYEEDFSGQIVQTMFMLQSAGHEAVCVVVPELSIVRKKIVPLIMHRTMKDLGYSSHTERVVVEGSVFHFYSTENAVERLRGAQFDAAILVGNPSEEFVDHVRFGVRIGTNPIRVFI